MRTDLEKRDCARFYHEAPIVVEKCGTGAYYEARMYNYSLQGMYFESDLALLPGARVNLWLSNMPKNALPEIHFAEVRWSEEIVAAVVLFGYGTGIKYIRPVKHCDFPGQFRIIKGGRDPEESVF
ncbi:MAG: PilZ domain-containing protein [Desulfobacterales bacterium]|nr:MAG: PilZ domain-containing protein [Desulfobacterales bacterium]